MFLYVVIREQSIMNQFLFFCVIGFGKVLAGLLLGIKVHVFGGRGEA